MVTAVSGVVGGGVEPSPARRDTTAGVVLVLRLGQSSTERRVVAGPRTSTTRASAPAPALAVCAPAATLSLVSGGSSSFSVDLF